MNNNFRFKRWYMYIYIRSLVLKTLLFMHPVNKNKKTLIRTHIWNASTRILIDFRERSYNCPVLVIHTHKIRSLIIMYIWNTDIHKLINFLGNSQNSEIIHTDHSVLFTHTTSKSIDTCHLIWLQCGAIIRKMHILQM